MDDPIQVQIKSLKGVAKGVSIINTMFSGVLIIGLDETEEPFYEDRLSHRRP